MEVVREAFNEHRNYVQGRCKEAIQEYCKLNGDIPSPADIYAVATRTFPKADTPELLADYNRLMAIFVWWWNNYLPGVAGSKHWRLSIRTTQTISAATTLGVQCIPKGTEAFAVLMYENCHPKWVKLMEVTEKFTKKVVIPRKKDDAESDDYLGQYTSSRSGQSSYGGWSVEGKNRFNELTEKIEEGRAKDESPHLESECLGLVREANKMPKEVPDGAAAASKKKRKRKRDAVEVVHVACVMDD